MVDSANYLKVEDSKLTTKGTATLKSNNLMQLNKSNINAGKDLIIDSNHQLITNGQRKAGTNDNLEHRGDTENVTMTTLQADKVVSINSRFTQSYEDTMIEGGAVLLNSGSYVGLNKNLLITAQGNKKLGADKSTISKTNKTRRNTLNGDLSIVGGKNITIDPKKTTLKATGDVNLISRGGTLRLKGHAGSKGLGSEKVVQLKTAGQINLAGNNVLIEGADLRSTKKGVNLVATDGSVELKGVKDSFKNKVSSYNINILKEQQKLAQKDFKIANKPIASNILLDWLEYHQAEYNRAKDDYWDCQGSDTFKCRDFADYRKRLHSGILVKIKGTEAYRKYQKTNKLSENMRLTPLEAYNLLSTRIKEYDKEAMSAFMKNCSGDSYCKDAYDDLHDQFSKMSFNLKISDEYAKVNEAKKSVENARGILDDINFIIDSTKKPSTGYEHKDSKLTAKRNVNIIANDGGILLEGTDINAASINIKANGNLPTNKASHKSGKRTFVNNDSIRITGLADVYTQGDVKKGKVTGPNYSYHQLINQANLNAKGDINIAGNGTLKKESNKYRAGSKTYTTNNAVVVNSANINAKGNVNIDAITGDLLLEASQVAFMDGSQHTSTSRTWYGKKKTKTTTIVLDNRNAITTDITANNIKLKSDGHIKIYGSELSVGRRGDVDIEAGKGLYLYSIEDRKYSNTDIKKRSSWLGIRYNKDHTNDTHQEISQLPTKLIGGKAYTKSGHNTLLEGTVFETLKPADIQVGVGKYANKDAKLILAPIAKQIQNTHSQQKESTVWQKQVSSGNVVTTAELPKFNQTPTITSAKGIEISVPVEVTVKDNQKAKKRILSQKQLGAMAVKLSKQPGYEYLAALDKRNDINWKQVELIQKNWHYEQEGLTPAAAALIALAVTMATGGSGAGVGASLTNATSTIGISASNAAFASLASQASVTLINNKGNINKTLKDLGSKEVLKGILVDTISAGLNPTSAGDKIFNLTDTSLAVISVLDPDVGVALSLINGSRASSTRAFIGNMTINYGKQKAIEELSRFAKKNGLTLKELNTLLQINSVLGLKYAGPSTRKHIDESGVLNYTIEGFFGKKNKFKQGVFWDLNDTLLNIQGINDAVALSVINDIEDYTGEIKVSGHSLGAARANNLVYTGHIKAAEAYSLPFFAIPAESVHTQCVASDAICGGFLLSIFRDRTTIKPVVSYIDWFNKSHRIKTAYKDFPSQNKTIALEYVNLFKTK